MVDLFEIRALADKSEELDAVVELHQRSFSDLLVGQTGSKLIRWLYVRLLKSARAVILLAVVEGKVVGFLCAVEDDRLIFQWPFYGKVLRAVVLKTFRRPSISLNIYRALVKSVVFSRADCKAELFSIAVAPDARRRGIARSMIQVMEEWMRARSISEYKVFTDTRTPGFRLYDAMEFKLARKAKAAGAVMCMYRRCVIPPETSK